MCRDGNVTLLGGTVAEKELKDDCLNTCSGEDPEVSLRATLVTQFDPGSCGTV